VGGVVNSGCSHSRVTGGSPGTDVGIVGQGWLRKSLIVPLPQTSLLPSVPSNPVDDTKPNCSVDESVNDISGDD